MHFRYEMWTQRASSMKKRPITICFEHFQIFEILDQNQLIFEKSGILAENWSFFKNIFCVHTFTLC